MNNAGRLYAGEPFGKPLKSISEPLVVNPQTMEDCCVQVMHVNRVPDDIVAVIVRLTVFDSRTHAAAREPRGKTAAVMVTAVVVFGKFTLAIDGPTEFTSPDYQRLVEHSSLLEVMDQGCGWLIGILALKP